MSTIHLKCDYCSNEVVLDVVTCPRPFWGPYHNWRRCRELGRYCNNCGYTNEEVWQFWRVCVGAKTCPQCIAERKYQAMPRNQRTNITPAADHKTQETPLGHMRLRHLLSAAK